MTSTKPINITFLKHMLLAALQKILHIVKGFSGVFFICLFLKHMYVTKNYLKFEIPYGIYEKILSCQAFISSPILLLLSDLNFLMCWINKPL